MIRNTRWQCPHCGNSGWSTHALSGLYDHDRVGGRKCVKAFRLKPVVKEWVPNWKPLS